MLVFFSKPSLVRLMIEFIIYFVQWDSRIFQILKRLNFIKYVWQVDG